MKQDAQQIRRDLILEVNELRTQITRLKETEVRMRELEEFSTHMAESSPVGVYLIVRGHFRYVNTRFLQSTGYREDEVVGRNSFFLVHPDDRDKVRRQSREMLRGRRTTPCEFRTLAKDGKIRWILGTVAPVTFRGEPAILGNYMDITTERETRRRLEELLVLDASILDALPLAVLVLRERKILFANPAAELVFGWTADELVHKDTRVLYRSDEEYEEIGKLFYPVLETQRTHFEEFYCRRKDGRDILCFVSTARIGESLEEKRIVAAYQDITARKLAEEELKQSIEKLRKATYGVIRAIDLIVETRDPYTAGHQHQVARLASAIATEMKLPADTVESIFIAGSIHDLGKIYVPAEILSKPGPLNEVERGIVRTHPRVGYDILKTIDLPWPTADIVLQHHERLDGSGYPRGLKDGEIRIEARIIAVADVVESIGSHRPYRPTIGVDHALEEVERHRGVLYDPDVVDACRRLILEKGYALEEKGKAAWG